VQVDPIKPTFKAPGTERLKPKYDEPPSSFAFKLNLRRYSKVENVSDKMCVERGLMLIKARQCRLTLSNPRRKRLELTA